MLLCIVFILTDNSGFFFVGGSFASITDVTSGNKIISILLFVCFCLLVYFYIRRKSKIKLIALGFIFILWILSGRNIAVQIYPEGKLTLGWFNMRTEIFSLCKPEDDCEKTIYYETKIEYCSFWRIRIYNEHYNKKIFVGPFIWNKTIQNFNKKFNSGRYYGVVTPRKIEI